MAEENLENVKKKSRKAVLWIFSILLIIGLADYYNYWGLFDESSEQKTDLVRSCKDWKKSYPTITNTKPNGFTVGKGTWILEVNSKEWKQLNFTQRTSWVSEYTGTTQTKTPDGGTMSGPGDVDYTDVYSSLKFKGKGCILVTTNKGLQLSWKKAKPANLK